MRLYVWTKASTCITCISISNTHALVYKYFTVQYAIQVMYLYYRLLASEGFVNTADEDHQTRVLTSIICLCQD